VPEIIVAARAMHAGIEELRPLLSGSAAVSAGKLVIGTVKETCTTSARSWSR